MLIVATMMVLTVLIERRRFGGHKKKKRAYAEQVDGDDVDAVSRWASEICRNASIEDIASALKVEPILSAVFDALASGLPDKSREAVEKICTAELTKVSTRP
jgi:hypothetical protein